jgi:type III secretion protein J
MSQRSRLGDVVMRSIKSINKSRLRCGAALVLVMLLAGCKEDLYTKMSEREANEMLSVLLRNGIDASRTTVKDGTSVIRVETAQRAEAIELLTRQGLPKSSFNTINDVFKGGGLVASPTEERARFSFAVSEELSRTLSAIEGVISARVHVAIPKNETFRSERVQASASVLIRHDSAVELAPMAREFRMLVANGIEGISYDRVSVTLVPVDRVERPMRPAVEASGASWLPPPWIFGVLLAALAAAGVFLLTQSRGPLTDLLPSRNRRRFRAPN